MATLSQQDIGDAFSLVYAFGTILDPVTQNPNPLAVVREDGAVGLVELVRLGQGLVDLDGPVGLGHAHSLQAGGEAAAAGELPLNYPFIRLPPFIELA